MVNALWFDVEKKNNNNNFYGSLDPIRLWFDVENNLIKL